MKKKLFQDQRKQEAYEAGWDYAENGVSKENCHFSLFDTPDRTLAWQQGKEDYRDQE